VLLTDELIQGAGAHAGGQRLLPLALPGCLIEQLLFLRAPGFQAENLFE
jgi:hypothetical protein